MGLQEKLSEFWNSFTTDAGFTVAVILGVIAFSLLYFSVIRFLLKNNSRSFVIVFVIAMLVGGIMLAFSKDVNEEMFLFIPSVFVILTISLYAVEIKRVIWANTTKVELKRSDSYDKEKIQNCISEIIKALQHMSKNDVGAIIILSSANIPHQIIDSGVKLDSDISSELIESVFFPKTPLHDGAMIINDTKIVAAGCFLPLSQNVDNIPKELGTRHRAGIGVTETIDVISLIVSEETGVISIAKGGKITRYADTEILKQTLTSYYWQDIKG